MNAPSIKTLLIDDEILARLALRQALASHPEVEVAGECANAEEALKAIESLKPDLLFLDIRMPGMDGFKLLRNLSPRSLPLIVFTTAYAQHALRAFDAGVTDYVLKPIDQARFDRAIKRVRQRWQGLAPRPRGVNPRGIANDAFMQRISVRVGERARIVQVADIDWIRADGNYVHIHAGTTSYLHRQTLRGMLAALDPALFLRIHRGIAVRIERIHEVRPLFNGNAEVVLHDGTRLPMSRRFRNQASTALGL